MSQVTLLAIVILSAIPGGARYGIDKGSVTEAEVTGNRAVVRLSRSNTYTLKRGQWRAATLEEVANGAASEPEARHPELDLDAEPDTSTPEARAKLTKEQLELFGRANGVELDRRETKAHMLEQLEVAISAAQRPKHPAGTDGQDDPAKTDTQGTEGATGPIGPVGGPQGPVGDPGPEGEQTPPAP